MAFSKSFAATGVRVGWAFGPKRIIDKMKAILSHIGAWAPKPEQVATSRFLKNKPAVETFMSLLQEKHRRAPASLYEGFSKLKSEGYSVHCISPMAAIYLTVQFDLKGMKTAEGKILAQQSDVTSYLLNEGKLALVPFFAFGSSPESSWYRLSVGTCAKEEIADVFISLRKALSKLSK